MDCALRFVSTKRHLPEPRSSKSLAVCQRLAFLICVFLLPAPLWSTAQSDSDHVQQSGELMSTGDLVSAEKEARLALRDSSTRPVAWATLGMIRVRQKQYTDATAFLRTALRLDP
jgi:cytochrome c-type biogenesis protein CcmH/NrfG